MGNFRQKLDDANRVPIPAKFKEVLDKKFGDTSSHVVLFPELGKIKVYPVPVWQKREESEVDSLPSVGEASDDFRSFVYGFMTLSPLDGQNRVKLSPGQCELAGIDKEVVFVGKRHEMEIWSLAKWEAFKKDMKSPEKYRANMAGLVALRQAGQK